MTTGRLEGWVEGIVRDKERLARWMVVAYWVSTAFTLVGAVLILIYFLGWRP